MAIHTVEEGANPEDVIMASKDRRDHEARRKLKRGRERLRQVPPIDYEAVIALAANGAPGFRGIDTAIPVRYKDYKRTLEDEVRSLNIRSRPSPPPTPKETPMPRQKSQSPFSLPSLNEEAPTGPRLDLEGWVGKASEDTMQCVGAGLEAILQMPSGTSPLKVLKTERERIISIAEGLRETVDPQEFAIQILEIVLSATVFSTVTAGWLQSGDPQWTL